jgi:hypothetical protein
MVNGICIETITMDFKELLRASAIRKLPAKVSVALYCNIFLIIGILITFGGLYLISTPGFKANFHVSKHYLEADGEITDAWVARQEDSENDAIIAYEYIFYNAEIGQLSGISYGTIIYPIGQPIVVRYDPFDPQYNRAANLKVSMAPPLSWLQVSGILLVGLALLSYGLLVAIHRTMYLGRGQITWATKLNKQHEGQETDTFRTQVYCYTDSNAKDHYLSKDYKIDEYVARRIPVIYLPRITHRAQLSDSWKDIVFFGEGLNKYIREQIQ